MQTKLDSILLPLKDCKQANIFDLFSEPNGLVRCKVLELSHPHYAHLLVAFRNDRKCRVELSVPHFAIAWILRGVTDRAMGFLQEAPNQLP